MVHLIVHSADTSFLAAALPPGLDQQEMIFIPINDEEGKNIPAGGSHW